MSPNLIAAFNFLAEKQGREMTLERGATSVQVRMAPSNYARNLSVVEEIVEEGREFVLTKTDLDATAFGSEPRRGDVIVDAISGTHSIIEVREMYVMGTLAGYRIRTG